ncbi:MAG: hypothetical protein KJ795_13250 [Gammaproteobacteria bacterium]|nr:hypothetical protein [Gammaproteobacteria bacterium]MBU1968344.1 hypothetical protein [Gammaproteobacteria bacterium]
MTKGKVEVIIFDIKKNIQSVDNKMTEPASHTEWEIFHLTSNEGGHDVLRISRDGQCEAHVDYYSWCNYDTEPSDKEDYDEAMCGEKIEDFDTGF